MVTAHSKDEKYLTDDSLHAVRSAFSSKGTSVYGWPSTGGIWVHNDCYAVELDFLHLSRFLASATQRGSPEEDEFCERLKWIGADFYESEDDYLQRLNQDLNSDRGTHLWTAWPGKAPAGGVWALWTKKRHEALLGVSRIRNAHTMHERCDAIEMLGGKLYETWEDIPARPTEDDHSGIHLSLPLQRQT